MQSAWNAPFHLGMSERFHINFMIMMSRKWFINVQLNMRFFFLNAMKCSDYRRKKKLRRDLENNSLNSIIRRNKNIRIFLNTYEWMNESWIWAGSKCGAFLLFITLHTHTHTNTNRKECIKNNTKECEAFFFVNETSIFIEYMANESRRQRERQDSLCIFSFSYCKNWDRTKDLVVKMIKFSFGWIRNS